MKVLYGTASRHFGALSFDLFDDATARVVFRCRQQSCASSEMEMKMNDEKYLGSVLQSIKRRNGSSFAG